MKVVIPIQTIGFYNELQEGLQFCSKSCHTYPSDRLLQHGETREATKTIVVIPIQTIGFYNGLTMGTSIAPEVVIPIQTIGFYNSPVYWTLKKSFGIGLTFL